MALVIVASALPMAVLCTSTPAAPGAEPDYSVALAGERDPAAVHGIGLTYDVDDVAFGEWIALNPDLASHVKITDQAEIDAWADTHDKYGYELFLEEEPAALSGLGELRAAEPVADADDRLATALVQHRAAEATLRQAIITKTAADEAAENATIARDAARDEAAEAQRLAAERAPPPPPVRPQQPEQQREA